MADATKLRSAPQLAFLNWPGDHRTFDAAATEPGRAACYSSCLIAGETSKLKMKVL